MSNLDPLELELAALRPREPSVELKQRIAGRLAESTVCRTQAEPSYGGGGALVGGLLAATLAAVLVWHRGSQTDESPLNFDANIAAALDRSSPSLWSYRRTIGQQSASLDKLLDSHASRSLVSRSSSAAFVFARSNCDPEALNGDL